jgi:hypothetical protein
MTTSNAGARPKRKSFPSAPHRPQARHRPAIVGAQLDRALGLVPNLRGLPSRGLCNFIGATASAMRRVTKALSSVT